MRRLLRSLFFLVYKPLGVWWISKERSYSYKGLQLTIPVGVFHPGIFFSTTFLAIEVSKMALSGKAFLELGCGSGLLSLVAAKAGANVTAVDINSKAVIAAANNARQNNLHIEAIESDLFGALAGRKFDVIAINPPYYKKNPKDAVAAAWFAGEKLEYFHKLFTQLGAHLNGHTTVLMVVSEDVDMQAIQAIAAAHNFVFSLRNTTTIMWELNYIYEIKQGT
ncbi:MAG TPA: methyltransferase [Chitinophagales bacterium]|nr:methyltransferase [Chitinophagales bacterium]